MHATTAERVPPHHPTADVSPEHLFSGPALIVVALLGAAYLGAARAQRRDGRGWAGSRIAFFCTGVLLLAVAVSPPMAAWAHHDLRGHAVQHLLIGMIAPLGLVLGAPVTLLLRTVSVRRARQVAGLLRTSPVRLISHPVTALLLNMGGMVLLYATPLFAATMQSHALHALVHMHFLAAGALFCWAVLAGPDPAPYAPGLPTRLGVLFVAMASHAVLGKLMYGYGWPRGTARSMEEIQAAAQLMYYGGDFAEVLLAIALFARWYQRGQPRLPAIDPRAQDPLGAA